jgi:hypothetical protein
MLTTQQTILRRCWCVAPQVESLKTGMIVRKHLTEHVAMHGESEIFWR